jgi:hypothetical protein
MPLLDQQRKSQQIGRIRIGVKVTTQNGKIRPQKIDTFRLTTGSRHAADAVAELLGGTVAEWGKQWEVITERDTLLVTVPPRDGVITQFYEMWNKGGCIRRCDSVLEQKSNKPCMCPSDGILRSQLAKMNPPQACKTTTRLNVMIPDLPGLGVWRFDTGSYYAALEMGDMATLLETARDNGVFLPAVLRIDQRERISDGNTTPYPVVVLESTVPFRALATGALAAGGLAAQLPPAAGDTLKAITATTPPAPAPTAASTSPHAGPGPEAPNAQQLADMAAAAVSREEIQQLAALSEQHLLAEDHVCTDQAREVYEPLDEFLRDRWRRLPRTADLTDDDSAEPSDVGEE